MSDARRQPRVLVTGGSRGIGSAIVRIYAARGASVLFTYRSDPAAATRLVDETRPLPGTVIAKHYDLDESSPEELVDASIERLGGLDSAILNAGTWRGGLLAEVAEGTWWNVVKTNLGGTMRLAKAIIPSLNASTTGSLLLMSSAVALIGYPGDTAYASSKAALTGFARSLAKEVGRHGVRVNVLAPGFVETDMTSEIGARSRERIIERSVLGRFGTQDEIASAAVFLSEEATFATGVVLPIDGGWTL